LEIVGDVVNFGFWILNFEWERAEVRGRRAVEKARSNCLISDV
jgi:hypothetical protein